jgi:hypothetical protein
MHGLTGGSWKRNHDQAMATEMNDLTGNRVAPMVPRPTAWSTSPRQFSTLHRMSSGSYFPPPVRAVEIPKPHGGGVRVLGVPTEAA